MVRQLIDKFKKLFRCKNGLMTLTYVEDTLEGL